MESIPRVQGVRAINLAEDEGGPARLRRAAACCCGGVAARTQGDGGVTRDG